PAGDTSLSSRAPSPRHPQPHSRRRRGTRAQTTLTPATGTYEGLPRPRRRRFAVHLTQRAGDRAEGEDPVAAADSHNKVAPTLVGQTVRVSFSDGFAVKANVEAITSYGILLETTHHRFDDQR